MEKKKTEIIPYLSFQGSCEEAIHAYIRGFGGKLSWISRWDEKNCDGKRERIGKVMHAEFELGGTRMAAADSFDCAQVNTGIKLMIHMDSETEALDAISVLEEGGTVLSPLMPHPKPDDGGCGCIVKDRFGFMWIVTCPNERQG